MNYKRGEIIGRKDFYWAIYNADKFMGGLCQS